MLQNRIDDQPTISIENLREAEGIFHQHLKRVSLKQTGSALLFCKPFSRLANICRSMNCTV